VKCFSYPDFVVKNANFMAKERALPATPNAAMIAPICDEIRAYA